MTNQNKTTTNVWEDDESADDEGSLFFGKKNDEKNGEDESEDGITEEAENLVVPKSKIVLAKKLLANIRENTEQLSNLLAPLVKTDDEDRISIGQIADEEFKPADSVDKDGRIIEGVFDGESMIGPDGKVYSVPANYASKSKLVEGDIMKLTITANGTFIYKQIGPIERGRVVGVLEKAADGNFSVTSGDKRWRILTASVTYFKGQTGDEAVILVPKAGESKWAAVENIIRNKE